MAPRTGEAFSHSFLRPFQKRCQALLHFLPKPFPGRKGQEPGLVF